MTRTFSLGPIPPPSKLVGTGFLDSFRTRIVVLILLVLGAVGFVATIGLARHEREQLIAAKAMAVTMTTELFAFTVSAALDLGDERDVAERMEPLRANRAIVYAAVWKSSPRQPTGELGTPPASAPPFGGPGVVQSSAYLTIVRPVLGPTGNTIGHVGVQISLEPENLNYIVLRRRMAMGAIATVLFTFALLFAALHWGVVARLQKVAQAATKLRAGENVRAKVYGRDELGQLGSAFNDMADAIVEREYHLANALGRLQTLLDHMGQAIVTFNTRGRILGDRSRQAEQLFGPGLREGASIIELLYPPGRDQIVESDSFVAWIDAVAESGAADWSELGELAPRSVTLVRDSGHINDLDLEFRLVQRDNAPDCIMLIATDTTQRKRLERVMAQVEQKHKKTEAALRWLLAGGGQLFVRFLDHARSRLGVALRTLRGAAPLDAEQIGQVFRDVHTVRAEARCFDLGTADNALVQVESSLAELRGGAIVDPVAIAQRREEMSRWMDVGLAALDKAEQQFVDRSPIGREVLDQMTVRRSDLERLVQLTAGRRDEVAKLARAMTARPFGESVVTVVDAAPRWAERVGKRIRVEVHGAECRVPGRLAERLPGILSHLVRNAIAHGIELSTLRVEAGKPPIGTIQLVCEGSAEAPMIRVEDDGRGLDVDALGSGSPEVAVEAAMRAGVTTLGHANVLAGYGVGLDAVRTELSKLDYEIELQHEQAKGTAVTLHPRQPGIAK